MQEMEMPTPCNECDGIFDLNDGMQHPRGTNIVICAECARKIESEVEHEETVEQLKEEILDAEDTIRHARARLLELDAD
jgi:hypothetical protein